MELSFYFSILMLFLIVITTFGYFIFWRKVMERLRSHHSKTIAPGCLYSDTLLGSKMLGSYSRDTFLYFFILRREYRGLKDAELTLLGSKAFLMMLFAYICAAILFAILIANFENFSEIVDEYLARIFVFIQK